MRTLFFTVCLAGLAVAAVAQRKKPEPTYKIDGVQKINAEVYQLVHNPTNGNVYVVGPKAGFNKNSENFVYVLNGTNLAVIDSISLGKKLPFGITVNNKTQTLYIGHATQNSVSAVDLKTKTQKIIEGVKEKGRIRELVVDENRNLVYVSDHGHPSIWIIDGATNTLKNSIEYPDASLLGLNVDSERKRIYTTDSNTMEGNILVFDSEKNELISKFKTWSYCPLNIAIDYKNNRLFVSQSNDNNVTVVDGNTGEIINKIYLGYDTSPIGLVYDEKLNVVYTANRNKKEIAVIDAKDYKVTERIPTGGLPNTISIDKATGAIYVTNKTGRNPEEKLENTNAVVKISKI
ncbi:YncE family protein [Dyadobacter sp. CY312]|uniref:YncE family protein n=1 Tax=Dyadobacter sp. CY312 TaxID=2907303 RepID=UPI001F2E24CA|nr:YncE family protein [Dyadobacter sp. CY312]MCE7042450.1 YncE family protein [Dyadobacter sp. CY312]